MSGKRPPKIRTQQTFQKLDGRQRLAKVFRAINCELINAIGGDPSPQEQILIYRVVFLLYRVKSFETDLLTGNIPSHDAETCYLSWVARIQSILRDIGLKRIPKPVAGELEVMLNADR